MAKLLEVTVALLVFSVIPGQARASAPRNVTPTLLSRGTYPEFHIKSKTNAIDPATQAIVPFEFMAKGRPEIDIVVRTHRYGAASENIGGKNSHTGWHTHPGPVFITVTEGELTIFEWDDVTCSNPIIVGKNQGYLDTGRGHIAINASSHTPAVDVTVITAPVGLPFRAELDFTAVEAAQRPECKEWMDDIHREPTSGLGSN